MLTTGRYPVLFVVRNMQLDVLHKLGLELTDAGIDLRSVQPPHWDGYDLWLVSPECVWLHTQLAAITKIFL